LAPKNRLPSLADLYRVATQVVGVQPQTLVEAAAIVGDVVFTEDTPAIVIDGKEIQLSRTNAAISACISP
jgi:hypothetical protein